MSNVIPILGKSKTPEEIGAYYDDLVDEHGHSYKACDANSQEALYARWTALTDVGDIETRSVLEVGCGFGDLGKLLHEGTDYTGIDISRRMIEEGRKVHPELDLRYADLLEFADREESQKSYDYVLAQGIFYKLPSNEQGAITAVKLLWSMVRMARKGVAFSTITGDINSSELRLTVGSVLSMAQDLTDNFTIRTDHWKNDIVAYIYPPHE